MITVTAELPGARRGARVQIARDHLRACESLDAWCEQLQRKTRTSADTPSTERSPATQESLLKELDEQYIQLGQAALWSAVPPSAAADKQAAVRAFRELDAAQKSLAAVEQHQGEASSRADRIQASSDVARCKARVRELQQQYRFLLLGLGRLIHHNQIALPESEEILRSIERIQQQFASQQP
jgi:hypothetical protein